MKTIALVLGAAAIAAFATSVSAQTTPGEIPAERAAGGHDKINFFDSYDANGDASVSEAEFKVQREKDFKRIDAKSSGVISEADYVDDFAVRLDRQLKAMRDGQIKQAYVRFGVLDTNKDGHISPEEFNASGSKLFSTLDTNRDGVVDEKDNTEKF